jgi:hypothetical protein
VLRVELCWGLRMTVYRYGRTRFSNIYLYDKSISSQLLTVIRQISVPRQSHLLSQSYQTIDNSSLVIETSLRTKRTRCPRRGHPHTATRPTGFAAPLSTPRLPEVSPPPPRSPLERVADPGIKAHGVVLSGKICRLPALSETQSIVLPVLISALACTRLRLAPD